MDRIPEDKKTEIILDAARNLRLAVEFAIRNPDHWAVSQMASDALERFRNELRPVCPHYSTTYEATNNKHICIDCGETYGNDKYFGTIPKLVTRHDDEGGT